MKKKKIKIESINIGLASPRRIKKWAERVLPNGNKIGEVTSSQTVNYKTLKPEKDGLFCERIFGPVKDFECACRTKKAQSDQKICPNCDVEFTASRIRRYRLGYIQLQSPVAHVWYLKGRPSYLSLLLGMCRKKVQSIVYYTAILHVPIVEFVKKHNINTNNKLITQYDSQVTKEHLNKSTRSQVNNKIKQKKNTRNSNNQVVLNKSSKAGFTSPLQKIPGLSSKTTLQKHLLSFQLNSLNDYYITKFKKKIYKYKLFKSNLSCLVSNTYYESLQIVQFDLLRSSNFFENIFIEFLKQQDKKFITNSSVALLHYFRCIATERVTQGTTQNTTQMSKEMRSIASHTLVWEEKLKQNKVNLVPTQLFLNKSIANKITHRHILPDKANLVNGKKKRKLVSSGSKGFITLNLSSKPILSTSLDVINQSLGMLDKKETLKLKKIHNPGGGINTSPPLSSLSRWHERKGKKGLDRKTWPIFCDYITCNAAEEDTLIPVYCNRLETMYEEKNNFNYESKKRVLNGSEAIFALLKSLHLENLKTYLQHKIQVLELRILKIERKRFLYQFEVKIFKKIIKLRLKTIRKFKLVRYFLQANLRPEWMILSVIPVLPPDLRPIIKLDGNQVAVSDLNKFYQRILFRNRRITRFRAYYSNSDQEMRFAYLLLQQAVDSLIENGKGGTPPVSAPNGRALKSLSDILKGKKGRFRQNLLGKRVDYSGRSVIVVAPELKLHECGLPKEMAIELFQPFLIRELRRRKVAPTIIKAKQLMQKQDPRVWIILQRILKSHPILLNRAPTLHRLGIQAFQAKLVNGKAILLHPLVCPAFNADFDGDQMAVHIPLSVKARAEAWKLMWSRNNILSPATGEPIIVPSQDMILGCYYLTTTILRTTPFHEKNIPRLNKIGNNVSSLSGFKQHRKKLPEPQTLLNQLETNTSYPLSLFQHYFSNLDDVLIAFQQKKILLHSFIWVRWKGKIEIASFSEKPLQLRIDCYGNTTQIYSMYWRHVNRQNNLISQFIRTTPGRVILNQAILQNITF